VSQRCAQHSANVPFVRISRCNHVFFWTIWFYLVVLYVVNLYFMLQNRVNQSNIHRYVRWYYAIGWGFPTLATVIVLSSSEFLFDAPNSVCFLSSEGSGQWIQYVLFYIPIGICLMISTVMITDVLSTIARSRLQTKRIVAHFPIRPYVKVLYVGVSYLGCYLLIFCGRFSLDSNKDELTTVFTDWVGCQVQQYIENGSYLVCGIVPPKQADIHTLTGMYTAIGMHGIVVLLLFVFDPDLYTGWGLAVSWLMMVKSKKPLMPTNTQSTTASSS